MTRWIAPESIADSSFAGLPSRWTPGETYPLTISLQRGGAMRYGFQLSAVVDATTQRAGLFTNSDSKISLQELCSLCLSDSIWVCCSVCCVASIKVHQVSNTNCAMSGSVVI